MLLKYKQLKQLKDMKEYDAGEAQLSPVYNTSMSKDLTIRVTHGKFLLLVIIN